MKYRKKPVVVECMQYLGPYSFDELLEYFGEPFAKVACYNNNILKIKTLEGDHYASIGDFIIKGVKGEFYPCKPDIFQMTYESVPEKFPDSAIDSEPEPSDIRFNPRRWTKEMSDAWHKNIPDIDKAFAALEKCRPPSTVK